jgi:Uncharacterised nucleotidyltransferase
VTSKVRAQHGLQLLLRVLRNRDDLAGLTPADWDALLPAAEHAKLSARLAADAEHLGLADGLPDWARDRLISSHIRGNEFERLVRWEIDRIHRALLPVGVRPVFLKGAGYLAAGLACASGRVVLDIDILVPEADLARAQAALVQHGWQFEPLDAYDERYYREWMHELPPLRHQERGVMLDLHHAILPRTGRLQPDSRILLGRTVTYGGAAVLCPTHMVLHAAVHLFYDGPPAIRDIADIDGLLRHFATAEADFWAALVRDARELGLARPAFYALRYAQRLVGTPIPTGLWTSVAGAAPAGPVAHLMDALVDASLHAGTGGVAALSSFALFVRSHWLRMPPLMLARHLVRKAVVK